MTVERAGSRRPRPRLLVAAAVIAAVVVATLAVAAALAERGGGDQGEAGTGGLSTTEPVEEAGTPSPEPVPGAARDEAQEPAIDPFYGDTVVDTGSAAEPAVFADGLSARLVSTEATTVEASGVGQSSGPAIEVVVELRNAGSAAVSLDAVTVNLFTGEDRVPGVPVGSTPFSGQLAPGASATARYTFGVDDERGVPFVTLGTSAVSGLVVLHQG